jgi:hypothetical protein
LKDPGRLVAQPPPRRGRREPARSGEQRVEHPGRSGLGRLRAIEAGAGQRLGVVELAVEERRPAALVVEEGELGLRGAATLEHVGRTVELDIGLGAVAAIEKDAAEEHVRPAEQEQMLAVRQRRDDTPCIALGEIGLAVLGVRP